MRIAIATNFLYPEGLGGTELYCQQLALAFAAAGHEVFWVVPNFNQSVTVTEQRAERFAILRFAAVEEGKKPEATFVIRSFINELVQHNIAVVHFNEFGGMEGINTAMFAATNKAGIGSVVTLHLVHYICQTGTVRFGGVLPCSGEMIPNRCGSCSIFSNASGSRQLNLAASRFFTGGFHVIDRFRLHLFPRVKEVMGNFKTKIPFIKDLREEAGIVVSLTGWFKKVLLVNAIPAEKIVHIPQATPADETFTHKVPKEQRNGFVFISRINKEKGIDTLLKAAIILESKAPSLFIDLYGPVPKNNPYADFFMQEINRHPNIRYKGVLPPADVFKTIAHYKGFLLPSHVAEMAPLSITEASKLEVPVIASDVPGSAELVNTYKCGLIFKYDDVEDLVDKILQVENNKTSFEFHQPVQHSFSDIAIQYLEVYNKAIAKVKRA